MIDPTSLDTAYASKDNIVHPDAPSGLPVYVPAADEPITPVVHEACGTVECCGKCPNAVEQQNARLAKQGKRGLPTPAPEGTFTPTDRAGRPLPE